MSPRSTAAASASSLSCSATVETPWCPSGYRRTLPRRSTHERLRSVGVPPEQMDVPRAQLRQPLEELGVVGAPGLLPGGLPRLVRREVAPGAHVQRARARGSPRDSASRSPRARARCERPSRAGAPAGREDARASHVGDWASPSCPWPRGGRASRHATRAALVGVPVGRAAASPPALPCGRGAVRRDRRGRRRDGHGRGSRAGDAGAPHAGPRTFVVRARERQLGGTDPHLPLLLPPPHLRATRALGAACLDRARGSRR